MPHKYKKTIFKLVASIFMIVPCLSCNTLKKNSSQKAIVKKLTIQATPGKVWAALTTEQELGKWWGPGVKLEPHVGGKFYEPWGDGQLATGKVLAVKPLKSIRFTWQEKSWKPLEVTTCMLSLAEAGGGGCSNDETFWLGVL